MNKVIHELTIKITNYIETNSDIKNEDRLAEINYALQVMFNEILKILILVMLFLALGRLGYFLFSLGILISIRTFSGGYHCNTTLKCLLVSALFFFITSYIGLELPKLSIYVYYLITLISIVIVVSNAPFPNKKRPMRSQKRRFTLKLISIFFTILWTSILLFFIKDSSYINCGFLTILLAIIQIIPIKKGAL